MNHIKKYIVAAVLLPLTLIAFQNCGNGFQANDLQVDSSSTGNPNPGNPNPGTPGSPSGNPAQTSMPPIANPANACPISNGVGLRVGAYCNVFQCNDGYLPHYTTNTCVVGTTLPSCTVENGSGRLTTNGICVPFTCNPGFKKLGNACAWVPTDCAIANGAGKTQTSDVANSCRVITCNAGYVMDYDANACMPAANYSACAMPNGTGLLVNGFCTATSCDAGYSKYRVCSQIPPESCRVDYGKGQISNGSCVVLSCSQGFVKSGNTCVLASPVGPGTQSCAASIPNSIAAIYSAVPGLMGPCVVTLCNSGFYTDYESNTCTANSSLPVCAIANGSGRVAPNGRCFIETCNPGYMVNGSICSPSLVQ